MALLDIRELSFTYPDGDKPAIDKIDLSIERGELVTVAGATGSGKSTLLRQLKPELRQNGDVSGSVTFDNINLTSLSPTASAERIAYVAQSPEEQIVTDKVWHELAFTAENLGMRRDDIARRVAEISAYFHIEGWYDRETATLSGGEKQLLNLASVMITDPDVLILDEPTAQLDPVAAERFIDTVSKLNRETGLTVIVCEHRTDLLIPLSDRLVILDGGRIAHAGTPAEVARGLAPDSPYLALLPAVTRFYKLTGGRGEPVMTVREGQAYLRQHFDDRIKSLPDTAEVHRETPALELKNIYFRYDREQDDVLRDLSLRIYEGEVFALLGANGAGKSTAAAVAVGLRKPYSGSVKLYGKKLKEYKDGSLYRGNLSVLPQDVENVFLHNTVREELKGCEEIAATLPYDLSALYDRHPYDLSGGERQLVALCKVLATDPRLLILDEPSKGLDRNRKAELCDIIKGLKARGITVVLISHDVELAAMCADRCAMFAHGGIAACDSTARFMSGNRFYTTSISRMTHRMYDGAYTVERAAALAELNGGRS